MGWRVRIVRLRKSSRFQGSGVMKRLITIKLWSSLVELFTALSRSKMRTVRVRAG